MTKYLAAALLATVLFTCTASAQTTSTKTAAADSAASTHREGQWRASKLVGVNLGCQAPPLSRAQPTLRLPMCMQIRVARPLLS